MERHLQGAPATISQTWYESGAVVDPGVVTIQVDREDGTNLIPADTATSGTGAAARTYTLTAVDTALLDVLKVTWTSPTKGAAVSYHEVVGGFFFTEATLRAQKGLDSTTTYPSDKLRAMRTLVEQSLEHSCGVAFVPRYAREQISGSRAGPIILSRPKVRAIRAITADDTALTSTELADTVVYASQLVRRTDANWTAGFSNVEVTYEHGHDEAPARVASAALMLARSWLIHGPLSERTTSMTTDDGTFSMVTPGMRGAQYDLPEVNAVVQEYGQAPLAVF